MVNWMKIIDPYKKNLLSDLEKLLLIPLLQLRTQKCLILRPPLDEALDYLLEL